MSRSLIVVRPEPGCSETVQAASELGLDAWCAPLFDIEPMDWALPEEISFDGLLAGSANVFRHAGSDLTSLRHLPLLAVGDRTATAGRAAGFTVAQTGGGGLQSLLDEVVGPATLLRLAGEAHVRLSPPAGVTVIERIVYRAAPRMLSQEAARALRAGAVVLLHSAEAARHFASECDRLGISRRTLSIATLGQRISQAAGAGWREVRTAAEPTDRALLALAADMCH